MAVSPWGMTGTLPKPKPLKLPYTPPTMLAGLAMPTPTTTSKLAATPKPTITKVGQAPSTPTASATNIGARTAAQPQVETVNPSYDYNADPILQQVQALTKQNRSDAQSQALSLRKQLAIDYGDEAYARDVLGDTSTAAAAAGNPNSVRAQLKKSYDEGVRTLEDQLNKSNLFYSGERIRQNQLASENYQTNLAGATGREQSALGSVTQNLAAALAAADDKDLQAAMDAANRAYQYPYYTDPGFTTGAGGDTGGVGAVTPIEDLPGALTKVPLGAYMPTPAPRAAPKKKATINPWGYGSSMGR